MRNHLGTYECKLCLTLHNTEVSVCASARVVCIVVVCIVHVCFVCVHVLAHTHVYSLVCECTN